MFASKFAADELGRSGNQHRSSRMNVNSGAIALNHPVGVRRRAPYLLEVRRRQDSDSRRCVGAAKAQR